RCASVFWLAPVIATYSILSTSILRHVLAALAGFARVGASIMPGDNNAIGPEAPPAPPDQGAAPLGGQTKTGARRLPFSSVMQPSGHVDGGLHDGAFGGDRLGVRLVVALRLDQLHQLGGQVDVGFLQGASLNGPEGTGLGHALDRYAGRVGFHPGGATDRLQ